MGGADISDQEKLDTIVSIIAKEFGTDVCSIYLLRTVETLELFATHGLNRQVVHKIRLKVGEGVVGDVAVNGRPLILSDVKRHPSFKYFPEADEDHLNAFAGIPISRGGRILGTLTVQNIDKRLYKNEEVETLQTIAMVLAEAVVASGILKPDEIQTLSGAETYSLKFKGITLNPGLIHGKALLHHPSQPNLQMVAENPQIEQERFETALIKLRETLIHMIADHPAKDQEERDLLKTYELYTQDKGWIRKISQAIQSGFTAEGAVQKTLKDLQLQIAKLDDFYLRERLWDFEDLSKRLLTHLSGEKEESLTPFRDSMILVARSLGPAELLDYKSRNVKALLLEETVHTAHVAIIARSLNIPVITKLPNILNLIAPDDEVIVDGNTGEVIVKPPPSALHHFERKQAAFEEKLSRSILLKDLPSRTLDGIDIDLKINAGVPLDLKSLEEVCAEGVGLYRTEIPFMLEKKLPDIETQTKIYREIYALAKGKPILFRTLDIGGDKLLPYLNAVKNENPVLGWRAIRIGLDRPMFIRQQLRALGKAAEGRPLYVMFPMISDVSEFLAARRIVELELEKSRQYVDLKLGAMIEVPSIIWSLDQLLPHVDFLSVGSNDLFQFFYAVDRANPVVFEKYDPLSPAFLHMLSYIVDRSNIYKIPVTLCGEMAGSPLEAMALIALGYRHLSMGAASIGAVKSMIRSLNSKKISLFVQKLLRSSKKSIRYDLHQYAVDHQINI